ncbi:DUF6765 family protein [Maridesulfovibrio sp.]|uniref:DUF6765 family protein n=1 Tax=unclassified Maridesulfovibrio TaxID=2794999 RepID=UPI003AFFB305
MRHGITQDRAQVIASASQFVDDNAAKKSVEFKDGGALHSRPTAHHAIHIKNIDKEDQRLVWVPFHFLPGNEGTGLTERLICRKNSSIAIAMKNNHLTKFEEEFGDELMGIAAHVYADTFSHYGFSGISSRWNKIENDSIEFDKDRHARKTIDYIEKRQAEFKAKYAEESGIMENIISWFAETFSGALGHGAACTFPDRPFLRWRFIYEESEQASGWRNNSETFLEACEKLHEMFCQYAKLKSGVTDRTAIDFSTIRENIDAILKYEGSEKERTQKWIEAVNEENILGSGEILPEYLGPKWLTQKADMDGNSDSIDAREMPIYQFYQAASYHRHFVLRNLLPENGLIVA